MDGMLSNVWFDRKSIAIEAKECRSSLSKIYDSVNELIRHEIESGIAANRIIVGGFSMGGALALHTGYHLNQKLAGVFGLSSFLNHNSIVYDSLKSPDSSQSRILPKLFMSHGDRDSLVPLAWGQSSFEELQKMGVQGEFVVLKNTMHELKKSQLERLAKWIEETLPPLESDLQPNNKL